MRYLSLKDLEEACYGHLSSNLVEGTRWGRNYRFYQPAQTKYGASQWLWDSGWHMIVWSHRNPENAIRDLRTLLQFQQPNGFIPEMIFWSKKRTFSSRIEDSLIGYSKKTFTDDRTGETIKGSYWTDITQMPMLAYSLRAIWNATKDRDLLKEFLPKLVRYQDWWAQERDPDGDGLVSIIHPWESGIDASPLYDPAFGVKKYPVKWRDIYPHFLKILYNYRHKAKWEINEILERGWFNFEDIGVCCCYADAWGVLGKLANQIDSKLAAKCRKQNEYFSNRIIEKAWNPELGQFVSFYHRKGKEFSSTHETIQSLFPLLLDNLPEKIQLQLVKKLQDPEKFGLPFPVPSTAKSDPAFDPNDSPLMWRGPSWGNTTWMVLEGLVKHGHLKVANDILDKWIEMSQMYGVSEFHNPFTGEMEGQEGLGMATTIVDWMHRLERL